MSTQDLGVGFIEHDGMGIVRLNRPRAINALNPVMIDAIHQRLVQWFENEQILAVLFEGEGERGFCAGGDVRQMREFVLSGKVESADQFFEREYALNGLIATYPKPTVALTHGVVMGGGIGLAGHAQVRITATGSRFAMPETAIGLMCDVGVNALLRSVPEHRALAFEMTGLPVEAGDAVALGLTDHVVPLEQVSEIRDALLSAPIKTAQAFHDIGSAAETGVEPTPFCDLADELSASFKGVIAQDILANIAGETARVAGAQEWLDLLAERCPTSLEVNVQSHRAARDSGGIFEVLERDRRLASWLVRRPDFAEGVRAVLVDKSQDAEWNPHKFAGVPGREIAKLLQN